MEHRESLDPPRSPHSEMSEFALTGLISIRAFASAVGFYPVIKKLVVFKPQHQFRHFLIFFAGGVELSNPKSALGGDGVGHC